MSSSAVLQIKDLQTKRENLVQMARIAESAERHADMCEIMKVCAPDDSRLLARCESQPAG